MFDFIDTANTLAHASQASSGLDLHIVFLSAHIGGVFLGLGGAIVSDWLFFRCVKDRVITNRELKSLKIASMVIWVGVAVLVLSGIGLFSQNPSEYLASSKFLVKMTVVLVIILNGVFFHHSHIPRIARHVNEHLPSSDEFSRKSALLVASGAVSIVSWVSAFMLGVMRGIPYTYITGVIIYVVVVVCAVMVALMLRERMLL